MATALGTQILNRYYEGTAGVPHLDQALMRDWVNQDEYDRALAGLPPEDYQPSPMKTSGAIAGEAVGAALRDPSSIDSRSARHP